MNRRFRKHLQYPFKRNAIGTMKTKTVGSVVLLLVGTAALWLSALSCPDAVAQFVEVPKLSSPIIDKTGVLGESRAALEQKVRAFREGKGSEIGVLIVPSTKPETIEQYGIRVVEDWKLGRQGIDDGVLLLVALEDRAVRIEVGRGLEGDLPDAKASRIIREIIIPKFRSGDMSGGIAAGVDSIISIISGMDLPKMQSTRTARSGHTSMVLPMLFIIVVWLFIVVWLSIFFLSAFGRLWGVVLGGISGFLIGLVMLSLIGGIIGLVVGLIASGVLPRGAIGSGRGAPRYRSGRGFGGSSFGGFGGGSFGGGGGFGGGGASGRW